MQSAVLPPDTPVNAAALASVLILVGRLPSHGAEYLVLLGLGLLAGWIGGLMGVGGSLIMIPGMAMLLGGDQQHLYQAAAMTVNVFVIGPAVLRHIRAGLVLAPVLRYAAPVSALASLLGVLASNAPLFRGERQGYLQILFGAFLAYVVCYNLLRLGLRDRLPEMDSVAAARLPKWKLVLLVAMPAGFLGGLLGIAGGAVAVPCQQIFLRVPLRRAIANSTAIVLLSSAVGAVFKNASLAGHGFGVAASLRLSCLLIPTAFAGSWVGASLVHRWPRDLIRIVFVLTLGYSSFHMVRIGWAKTHGRGIGGNPRTLLHEPRDERPRDRRRLGWCAERIVTWESIEAAVDPAAGFGVSHRLQANPGPVRLVTPLARANTIGWPHPCPSGAEHVVVARRGPAIASLGNT